MATAYLYPVATGRYSNLGSSPGAGADYEEVDEDRTAIDNDSTYLLKSSGTSYSDFLFDATGLSGTITRVDMHSRSRCTVDTTAEVATCYVTFDDITYVAGATNNLGTSYVDYTDLNVSRPGGGSWTFADFNTGGGTKSYWGVELTGTGSSQSRCTSFYLEITYTTSATPRTLATLGVGS